MTATERKALLATLDGLLPGDLLQEAVDVFQTSPPESYLAPPEPEPGMTDDEAEHLNGLWRDHMRRVASGDRAAILSEYQRARREAASKIGNAVLTKKTPPDPMEATFSRGYFAGARYFLEVLPSQAAARFAGVES